jgi:hypothetical protein
MALLLARVRTIWTGVAGTPAYSNFYFDADTTDAADFQAMVLETWDTIKTQIKEGVTATMVNPIPIINDGTGDVVDVAIGAGGSTSGTNTEDELPPMTSGLLQMHTGQFYGGRELRGRCFIPYPTRTLSSGGKPTSDYRGQLSDAFNGLLGISGANGAWRIFSPSKHVSNAVSSISIWDQWGSLRSRRD